MNKENSAPARILPEDNEGSNPVVSGSPNVWEHQFFGDYGTRARFFEQPSAEEDVECAAYIVDNTKGQYASLQSHVTTAGAASSELVVKYSTSLSAPVWNDFAKLSLRTASLVVPRVSTPLLMPNDSKIKRLLLKLMRRGGDGTISPEMWNAIITATSGRPPSVPSGGPEPPLPQDATWGDIVWDLNANGSTKTMYSDGADVNLFPDDSPTGYDASTVATLLLPKFQLTGIAGVLPCVEWAGANVYLESSNPTQPFGSWTYYLVIDGLDGGDLGYIINGENGYPFGMDMWARSNLVGAQVNTNAFGGTDCEALDTWGMADRHIYRWWKNSGSVHWNLAVDGIRVCDNLANPQTNDTTLLALMNYAGGLGMTGKIGRIVAYNQSHDNPSGLGTPSDGLTAPEIALRTFWGTP